MLQKYFSRRCTLLITLIKLNSWLFYWLCLSSAPTAPSYHFLDLFKVLNLLKILKPVTDLEPVILLGRPAVLTYLKTANISMSDYPSEASSMSEPLKALKPLKHLKHHHPMMSIHLKRPIHDMYFKYSIHRAPGYAYSIDGIARQASVKDYLNIFWRYFSFDDF